MPVAEEPVAAPAVSFSPPPAGEVPSVLGPAAVEPPPYLGTPIETPAPVVSSPPVVENTGTPPPAAPLGEPLWGITGESAGLASEPPAVVSRAESVPAAPVQNAEALTAALRQEAAAQAVGSSIEPPPSSGPNILGAQKAVDNVEERLHKQQKGLAGLLETMKHIVSVERVPAENPPGPLWQEQPIEPPTQPVAPKVLEDAAAAVQNAEEQGGPMPASPTEIHQSVQPAPNPSLDTMITNQPGSEPAPVAVPYDVVAEAAGIVADAEKQGGSLPEPPAAETAPQIPPELKPLHDHLSAIAQAAELGKQEIVNASGRIAPAAAGTPQS